MADLQAVRLLKALELGLVQVLVPGLVLGALGLGPQMRVWMPV